MGTKIHLSNTPGSTHAAGLCPSVSSAVCCPRSLLILSVGSEKQAGRCHQGTVVSSWRLAFLAVAARHRPLPAAPRAAEKASLTLASSPAPLLSPAGNKALAWLQILILEEAKFESATPEEPWGGSVGEGSEGQLWLRRTRCVLCPAPWDTGGRWCSSSSRGCCRFHKKTRLQPGSALSLDFSPSGKWDQAPAARGRYSTTCCTSPCRWPASLAAPFTNFSYTVINHTANWQLNTNRKGPNFFLLSNLGT